MQVGFVQVPCLTDLSQSSEIPATFMSFKTFVGSMSMSCMEGSESKW